MFYSYDGISYILKHLCDYYLINPILFLWALITVKSLWFVMQTILKKQVRAATEQNIINNSAYYLK